MQKQSYNESIFISYANTPLKNNPKGLYATLHQIEKYLPPLFPEIKKKIELLVGINGVPFSKDFEELYERGRKDFLKKMKEDEQWIKELQRMETFYGKMVFQDIHRCYQEPLSPGEERMLALRKKEKKDRAMIMDVLQEIHGAKLMGCQYNSDKNPLGCRWGGIRNEIFETKDLKCYECDQEHFNHLLTALIDGKRYSEIAGLKSIIDSYRNPQSILKISQDQNSLYGETIEKTSFKWAYGGMMSFPKIFFGAVTQSLVDFLSDGKRPKLKKCIICGNFFISTHARRRICLNGCRKTYLRDYLKKYMQKKRNKEGDDFDPRYI